MKEHVVLKCSRCGGRLDHSVLCSYPAQDRYDCPGCGYFLVEQRKVVEKTIDMDRGKQYEYFATEERENGESTTKQ